MQKTNPPLRLSREDLIRDLLDSGLFHAEDLNASLPDSEDAEALIQHLVSTGRLTPFQAQAVRERRADELRIGNYEVLTRLGAGGMGTVYKARHRRMKRVVALKVLSHAACQAPTFLQRFQREVEVISRLNHPNVVMAYDADESEAGHFLVMEFVNGRDLDSVVQEFGPLPPATAADAVLQAARALEYAHTQGIIHRDVKPANLLRDGGGVVKVADLGLARFSQAMTTESNSGLTQAGGIVGTVDYMPPEQAFDSASIDHRADVYSLGCTLYFLVAGRPPYSAESLIAILMRHRDAPVPSLADGRPHVPAGLDAVYRKLVAKKPEDRYQNMGEVVRALEGLALGPVAAPAAPAASAAESSLTNTAVLPGGVTTVLPAGLGADSGVTVDVASLNKIVPGGAPVLLVEPSRVQANIIRKLLQEWGADVILVAPTGRQALEVIGVTPPRAVVCAMHLDDMTGDELMRKVRGLPLMANVGFVLITSTQSDPGKGQAAPPQAPRMALLPKPFDRDKLAAALAAVGVPAG